jgi:hypothetical protein
VRAARWLPVVALAAISCSSSPSPPPSDAAAATGLVYEDPTDTGWRFVRDASSTPTRLVLDLVGPTGLMTRGVAFNLQAPPAVHFGQFVETNFAIRDTGVYQLLNLTPANGPNPLEPTLMLGVVKPGNLLTAGLFQKDRRATAKESGQPLCQIALELSPSATAHSGDALPLQITKSKYMADDIGAFSGDPTPEMRAKAHLIPATIALGSLHAQ